MRRKRKIWMMQKNRKDIGVEEEEEEEVKTEEKKTEEDTETVEGKKIWNKMTASVLKQDPNTKRFKRTLIYFDTDTVCKFSGKCPLSSHQTTLKQQINW